MDGYHRYNLFISQVREDDKYYNRIIKLINKAKNFSYLNYSLPFNHFYNNNTGIKKEIIDQLCIQIVPADVVLIISDMFNSGSDWIKFEIDIANFFEKPIIGIKPADSKDIPEIIVNNSSEIVDWDSSNIIHAIYKCTGY